MTQVGALFAFSIGTLFAPQKATLICGKAATSLGVSPHHLPKATSLLQSRTSFAAMPQLHLCAIYFFIFYCNI
jgi:hypothetical protein